MAKNPQATVNVRFVTDEVTGGGDDLTLELDTARIIQEYGENKTSFKPNEAAYVRVLASASDPVNVEISTLGFVNRVGYDIPYPITDSVTFTKTRTATLSYLPRAGSMSYDWLGRPPTDANGAVLTPLFSDKLVSLKEPTIGALKCDYETLGDRYKIVVTEAGMYGDNEVTVIVVATQNDLIATLEIRYVSAVVTPQPVELEVGDFCSDSPINNVAVYVDGSYVGLTNSSGKLYLGMLVPGSTHSLRMTRDGYIDSDLDVLYNDSFTVPTS